MSSTLRQRILAFVGALIIFSVLGSTISLYRITEVNQHLDVINRVSVPLGRLFTQMQADADVFHREFERSLGRNHWKDPLWQARPVPRWIEDVLTSELAKVQELIKTDVPWTSSDSRSRWRDWIEGVSQGLESLRADAAALHAALEQGDGEKAAQLYQRWVEGKEQWRRQLQWGAAEYEQAFRQTFSVAESRVAELRTALEMILLVVVSLSLLLLWVGERALRPLGELTGLAREITRGGLRKEHKAALPGLGLSRNDEVSQLAREFHNMATSLLEREKTVEAQKSRLQEQNRMLREMGELNVNILNSIESVLIVTDLAGKIAQCNPVAARWLEASPDEIIGSDLGSHPRISSFIDGMSALTGDGPRRMEPRKIDGRIYGGQIMPLRASQSEEGGQANGAILVIEDLTEELDLQERLRRAENLAAVGRMSAQVAHEVRNPLHSIGLEAEMAAELAARAGNVQLKQSLQSILGAVDRLEKITENYLKLSRLSTGERAEIDMRHLLEAVLATYAPVCEAQGVRVDWSLAPGAKLAVFGDTDLLEQVLGNLLRNSLQALQGIPRGLISISLGSAESGRVWIRIEDNGPGIPEEIRGKLFTPFVTTKAQGTGLGLSFVKKVIEDHGGTIVCLERQPEDPVRGAIFEVVLPGASVRAVPERHELVEEVHST